MKKTIKLLTLAAFTCLGTLSFAQSLNFSGGVNASTMRGDGSADGSSTETYGDATYTSTYSTKRTWGFNASIGYEFNLGNRLSLETGFKYQSRGYRAVSEYKYTDSQDYFTENYDYNYRINYLDIPIVLNTAILTGDFRLYARTGIYAGLITNGKFAYSREFDSNFGQESYEESERIPGEDFGDFGERIGGGIIAGVGAEYKGFYFEANYMIGTPSFEYFDDGMYTHDLSLSLGYKLKFNK